MDNVNVLYRYPLYYDIVFRRTVAPEVDFMVNVFQEYTGRPLRSVIELGCGPGYHARAFALKDYAVHGLDRSEEMIGFARHAAENEGAVVEWTAGDMRDFALSEPVDLAVCLFDSIDGLHSIDDFVRHFRAVAGSLAPDGLYIIGQSHQRDVRLLDYGPFHYQAERDGCKVTLDWATDVRTHTLTQTADVEIVVRVEHDGVRTEHRHRTVESFATPIFLAATARLSAAVEPVAWYGAFRLDQPYDDSPASTHCIAVFRKLPNPAGQDTPQRPQGCGSAPACAASRSFGPRSGSDQKA
jgi:SAM-dependent methyltransferase